MTAKEMFEDLGFKQKKNKYEITYYNNYEEVSFYLNSKKYRYISITTNFVDMYLHKAINKQIEELGWKNDSKRNV